MESSKTYSADIILVYFIPFLSLLVFIPVFTWVINGKHKKCWLVPLDSKTFASLVQKRLLYRILIIPTPTRQRRPQPLPPVPAGISVDDPCVRRRRVADVTETLEPDHAVHVLGAVWNDCLNITTNHNITHTDSRSRVTVAVSRRPADGGGGFIMHFPRQVLPEHITLEIIFKSK